MFWSMCFFPSPHQGVHSVWGKIVVFLHQNQSKQSCVFVVISDTNEQEKICMASTSRFCSSGKKKSPVLTSMYFHYCSQHVQCVHARVCVGCALTVSNLRQEQRQECDLSAASTRITCWNPRSVCSYGLCRTQPHGTSWWHSATWTAPTQPLRTHGPTCFLFFLHTIVLVDSRRWLTVRFRIKVKEKHAKLSMKSCFLFLFFFFSADPSEEFLMLEFSHTAYYLLVIIVYIIYMK